MTELIDVAHRLLAVVNDRWSTPEDRYGLASEVTALGRSAAGAELNAAMEIIVEGARHRDPARAGLAAMCCGVLVEYGAADDPIADVVEKRLPTILRSARRFQSALIASLPIDPDEIRFATDSDDLVNNDGLIVTDRVVDRAGASMRRSADAFHSLDLWCSTATALISIDPSLPKSLGGQRLIGSVEKLAPLSQPARILRQYLRILDDEPAIVLQEGTNRGVEVRISGIPNLLVFRVLLTEAVRPHLVIRSLPPRRTLAVTAPTAAFLWDPNCPDEIPKIDGTRLVTVNSTPNWKYWGMDDLLYSRATCRVDRVLDRTEVDEWRRRIDEATAAEEFDFRRNPGDSIR